jgi:hypothetical protein
MAAVRACSHRPRVERDGGGQAFPARFTCTGLAGNFMTSSDWLTQSLPPAPYLGSGQRKSSPHAMVGFRLVSLIWSTDRNAVGEWLVNGIYTMKARVA